MGPLEISLNGAPSGEGFVIVSTPAQPLPGTLTLRTTDGSEGEVTLRPAQGNAAALTIDPGTAHVSGTPVTTRVLASSGSGAKGDVTIEVVEGSDVVDQYALTALAAPKVRFSGRFECRLATNADPFNHPWGTGASGFRMYAIQGPNLLEPAQPPDEPPLDRIIRFHDGVALRPLCGPIGVKVKGIEAELGGARVLFEAGDPLIGEQVQLGPQCTFEEQDGAFAESLFQPIAEFRLEIGPDFAGASEPATPRPDGSVEPTSNAPYADGAFSLDDEGPWKPSDFDYPEATWLAHAQAFVPQKLADLQTFEPADERGERIRQRRIAEHQAFSGQIMGPLLAVQRFTGQIDQEMRFPAAPEGALAYLATLSSIPFFAEFFDFDTDCQCGTVTGTLGGAVKPVITAVAGKPLAVAEARGAPVPAGAHHP